MILYKFNVHSSPSSVGRSLTWIAREFRYDNGTWRFTTWLGAYASLSFNGTSVWVYGAKRNDSGEYRVELDGQNSTFDGFDDGGLFRQVLFSAVDLDDTKLHTLSITNQFTDDARPYLDVDWVSIPVL